MTSLTRREALVLAGGAALVAALPVGAARASAAEMEQLIAEFTGGRIPAAGRIALTLPEIAENGNSVPLTFAVESPMTAGDHVEAVLVVADGNPRAGVATFRFSPMSASAQATTRMRLAKTQNVVAIARMKDGSLFKDEKEVKVTIGGCGG